uniref:Uncharacterized protein n=1 Tax=Setaria italica TaxID=4555 RepID=K3ZB89_SETIT
MAGLFLMLRRVSLTISKTTAKRVFRSQRYKKSRYYSFEKQEDSKKLQNGNCPTPLNHPSKYNHRLRCLRSLPKQLFSSTTLSRTLLTA